jgi:hypothetical protein
MTSNVRVPGTARLVTPDTHVEEAERFYNRTVIAVWRLAVSLYEHDARLASNAVVDAYREVWALGPEHRHQVALLHALVMGVRAQASPIPA